jgi:hypothetical protein
MNSAPKPKLQRQSGKRKRVMVALRSALAEHIGLARQSLEAQISALSALEAKTKPYVSKTKKPRKRQENSVSDKAA